MIFHQVIVDMCHLTHMVSSANRNTKSAEVYTMSHLSAYEFQGVERKCPYGERKNENRGK